jgi:hypothetical protein
MQLVVFIPDRYIRAEPEGVTAEAIPRFVVILPRVVTVQVVRF